MPRLLLVLAVYASVVWWLQDHGRTPVIAYTLDRAGRWLRILALELGALSLDLQLAAASQIRRRSYT